MSPNCDCAHCKHEIENPVPRCYCDHCQTMRNKRNVLEKLGEFYTRGGGDGEPKGVLNG